MPEEFGRERRQDGAENLLVKMKPDSVSNVWYLGGIVVSAGTGDQLRQFLDRSANEAHQIVGVERRDELGRSHDVVLLV
jgi:hypothetical protein